MRDSRFELGRIIAMLMIVLFHVAVVIPNLRELSFLEKGIIYSIGSWGILGVNYFILLTAYFTSKKPCDSYIPASKTVARLGKLVCQSYIYILVAFAVLYFFGKVGIKGILTHVLFAPLFMDTYWFVWAYIGLVLLQPIIENILTIRSKYLFGIISILIFLMNLYPTHSRTPTDILWFVLLYIFYRSVFEHKKLYTFISRNAVIGFFFVSLIIVLSLLLEDYCASNFSAVYKLFDTYINVKRYSLLLVVDAIFFFAIFERMNNFHNRVVNWLATTMFGIYLFHNCNYLDLRTIIPTHCINYCSSLQTLFISTTILVIGGGIIDLVYRFIIQKVTSIKSFKPE